MIAENSPARSQRPSIRILRRIYPGVTVIFGDRQAHIDESLAPEEPQELDFRGQYKCLCSQRQIEA